MGYLVSHLLDRGSLPSFLAALRALPPAERIRPLLAAAKRLHACEPASADAIVTDAVTALRSLSTSERGGNLDALLPLRALVPLRDGLAEWTAMLIPHLKPSSMPLLYLWPSDHTEALQWFAGDAAIVATAQAIEEVALTFPRIRRADG